MADTLSPVHPLQVWAEAFAALPDGLEISAEPLVATSDVRGGRPGYPTVPNTWAATPHGRIVWLGPDEWLVSSDAHAPHELEVELRAGGPAVDVSAQRTELRLTGPLVRELLALGCSLDLHSSVFPPGTCAQTTVGQVGVVLIAADDSFHLLVRPSFAGHLAAWLLDAAIEFTPELVLIPPATITAPVPAATPDSENSVLLSPATITAPVPAATPDSENSVLLSPATITAPAPAATPDSENSA